MCDTAAENCPLWFGSGGKTHISFEDLAQKTGTVQDAILASLTSTSDPVDGIWDFFDFLEKNFFPGMTVLDQGYRYAYLNGTSMSSPPAAGVAVLVKEIHPNWSPGAVKAAVQRTGLRPSVPGAF